MARLIAVSDVRLAAATVVETATLHQRERDLRRVAHNPEHHDPEHHDRQQ